MTWKKGDKVYRVMPAFVAEIDWHVEERTIVVCSDKQIRLDSCFSMGTNLIFRPSQVKCEFFATPLEAVESFERAMRGSVEGAKTTLRNAETRAASAARWSAEWRKDNNAHECGFEPDVTDPDSEVCVFCGATRPDDTK